ncbi:MAG TPA: electron transfer flavoprotein subunit alpha/FixB family protein [Acidimicrobiales bacterium]|nr:electron transfer flavoprotein subunit alpha/FixB family protein [Acidimicrobiales bacterium]
MTTLLVVAEQHDGAVTAHSLELCSGASSLAAKVMAVTWGKGSEQAAAALGEMGAHKVVTIGDLGDLLAAPRVASVLAQQVEESSPEAVFAPATYEGRDIAARLSARAALPVIANAVAIERVGDGLVSTHLVFGGRELVRARFSGAQAGIFIVKAKSFPLGAAGAPGATTSPARAAPEVVGAQAPELGQAEAARVVSRHVERLEGPSLDDAKVVVAGGRGLGGAEHYALVEELARLLGGAPAASRAIVDAGWAPYANQVGQTGRTVKPDVYLAFGISGATQHLVGMKDARHIVAVNTDAEAPLIQVADLGIVGDVHQVLPRLIAALKARP